MRTKVLKILNTSLGGAEDNLFRANAFMSSSTMDMSAQYGGSGKTYQQIIDGYKKEVEELEKCIDWVKSK